MTASIGRGLVLLSLLCASGGAVAAFAAFLKKRADLTTLAVRAAYGFSLAMFLAREFGHDRPVSIFRGQQGVRIRHLPLMHQHFDHR